MNRRITQLNLLFRRNGYSRAAFLRKIGYFHQQGSGCFLQPWNYGTEPYLISLGDNVFIASNVKFVTHDVIALMLRSKLRTQEINERMGTISIGSNVFVGSDTTILYDVTIGDNVIVAAGSLVSKSLPSGTVCAGRPARPVGDFDSYVCRQLDYSASVPWEQWNISRETLEIEQEKYFWQVGRSVFPDKE